MKMLTFAWRNALEILRDRLNLLFGIGFPVVLILLLSVIQKNVPPEACLELFRIEQLAPGASVFGLSFMTLFSATLIAKDRGSSLLQRLYTTPLTGVDFILGYTLPILPISVAQTAVCYLLALALGLSPTANILLAILINIPSALFYIALGLLCGSVFTDKQVGGICGALLTNVSAWLSGIWFDVRLLGGAVQKIAECLPFSHAVDMARAALAGSGAGITPHLYWVLGYALLLSLAAVWAFLRQMKRQ